MLGNGNLYHTLYVSQKSQVIIELGCHSTLDQALCDNNRATLADKVIKLGSGYYLKSRPRSLM